MSKKILLITRNFPPLVGGMERFVLNVYKQLQKEYDCDVVGPRGCTKYLSDKTEAAANYTSPSLSGYLSKAFIKSIYLASTNKYSLCIAGSGITAPIANLIGKLFSIPVITFVYGLDLVVDNRIYQSLFVPTIKLSDRVIAISQSTFDLTTEKKVPEHKINILFPGVDIDVQPAGGYDFKKEYHVKDKKILLSVGRLIPRKGIPEFIENSLPKIIKSCPDTVFVIIGTEATNALKKDASVTDRIKLAISNTNLSENVIMAGRVDDKVLWSAYKQADLFVFPLREEKGDIEGFGLVAVEAAAFGLPSIAFAVGGVVDAIEDQRSGFLVPPGSYNELADVTTEYLLHKSNTVTSENCLLHARKFSWDNFGAGLREICRQVTIG